MFEQVGKEVSEIKDVQLWNIWGGAFQVYLLRVDEDEELLVACDSYVRVPHKLSDGHIFFHGSVYSGAFSFHHNCASGVTRWDRPMEVQREEHQEPD